MKFQVLAAASLFAVVFGAQATASTVSPILSLWQTVPQEYKASGKSHLEWGASMGFGLNGANPGDPLAGRGHTDRPRLARQSASNMIPTSGTVLDSIAGMPGISAVQGSGPLLHIVGLASVADTLENALGGDDENDEPPLTFLTGTGTTTGTTSGGSGSTVSEVPLPASGLLLLAGLVGLFAKRRFG